MSKLCDSEGDIVWIVKSHDTPGRESKKLNQLFWSEEFEKITTKPFGRPVPKVNHNRNDIGREVHQA